MATFIGNTATAATNTAIPQPTKIISFSLANKTGGATTVSVGLLYGSTFYIIYQKPLAAAGSSGSEYIYSGEPILVPPNYQIYVSVSGSTDYLFYIE